MLSLSAVEPPGSPLTWPGVEVYRFEPLPHFEYDESKRGVTDLDSGDCLVIPRGSGHRSKNLTWGLTRMDKPVAGGGVSIYAARDVTVFEIDWLQSWDLAPDFGMLARDEFDATGIAQLMITFGSVWSPRTETAAIDSRPLNASQINRATGMLKD